MEAGDNRRQGGKEAVEVGLFSVETERKADGIVGDFGVAKHCHEDMAGREVAGSAGRAGRDGKAGEVEIKLGGFALGGGEADV